MAFGAAIVVALVGYEIITPADISNAGDAVRDGVNYVLQAGANATSSDQTIGQKIDEVLK